jgi:4-carboxymuconolactone decarboxylase
MKSEKFKNGLKKLAEIDGRAGEQVIESLKDVSPDLAQYIIEYSFGDIYSRPQLDLKSREIATIAALTTLGFASPQLKVHINAGLNVGLSETEIKEFIIQMSVYAGFPAAINAMNVAKEVFKARKNVAQI